ncbi:hypothetical protein, partial [Aeromonas sanarellii]
MAVIVLGNWMRDWRREIEFEGSDERLERETRLELATPTLASADHALPTGYGKHCLGKLDARTWSREIEFEGSDERLERETRLELATPTL